MTKLTRRHFMAAAGGVAATASFGTQGFAQAAYPSRPIQLICPWGAGGGTDAVVRIIGGLMERDLGQPVNVVNRTGGSGVVGHAAIASGAADGYTIGIITVELNMMHWQGLTELAPTSYTPLALINEDVPGLHVATAGPYKTIQDLAAATKAAAPGKLKASGTSQGGIWHLALVGWLTSLGLKPDHIQWVPSNGSAPAMQDLAANGLDLVCCSLPEAAAMIDAKRVTTLVALADARQKLFPNVPTAKETQGFSSSISTWRGIAGPKGMPPEVVAKITGSLKKIYDSKEFADFMDNRGFGRSWQGGADFAKFMANVDAFMGTTMKAAGLTKA